MGRFFVYALLLWLAYFLVKKFTRSLFGPSDTDERKPGAPTSDADLIQDPQCGKYFLKQRGVKGVVAGKVLHFCSEECYDEYLKNIDRMSGE